ncbi:hypothetical protein [Actinoplanes sp. G11-F43]|uniref:hypothetical protein n=1 Tax=Actinoplanes sp. G11-F43 TaxID=3424130 RepID=UPI003D342CA9
MTTTDHETEVLPRPEAPADLTEALAAAAPRRWWNRTTVALLAVALVAGGFVGGVRAHERWGTEAATGPSMPEVGGFPGGRGNPSAGPSGGSVPGTTGTVKLVDGTTLYVQTADGQTVTVRTSGTTAVKLNQTVTLDKLPAGAAVTVQGVPDSEGVVTATAVTAG